MRPYLLGPDTLVIQKVTGPVRQEGPWQVTPAEIWLGAGDVLVDFSHAMVPPGETRIRVFAVLADVNMFVPNNIGVAVVTWAFMSDVRLFDQTEEGVVRSLQLASPNYQAHERRLLIEARCLVADVDVRAAIVH